ncbi:MAG: glycosyltransferase family 39 protein [Candidatus Doudnabacteria bacterium]
MKNFFKSNWVLLLILALALFFRFWQIGHLPGGLFPDEAANGLDVNSILHGHLQPFYERGNGREALFFYFEAFSVLLFGPGVWQFHIVSAAFGFAAVLAAYFLAKKMFGKRVALLSALFMAVSSYAVIISRTAFRANAVPLFSTLTLLFLVKFFSAQGGQNSKEKYWSAALAGISFGLGFYTYISFRMMLPLVVGFLIILAIGFRSELREKWREYAKYKAAFIAAFLLAISWIAVYFIQNPKSFVGRAGGVSVFNEELNHGDLIGTIILVFKKTFLSFFTHGDIIWRHNVSGFPFLSPLLSPFFALAVIWFTISLFRLLKQVWDQKIQEQTVYQALLACWFWFMLVPELATAEGIPHGLRLTGVIPVIFILAAWGVNWFWERMPHKDYLKAEKTLVAVIFVSGLIIYNFLLYFGLAASSAGYYYAFRSDLTDVSNYLNQRNMKDRTYLTLDTFSVQTTDYLTTDFNQPYILVDPAHAFEVKLKTGDQVVFTMSTLFDSKKFCESHPTAKLVQKNVNQFGLVSMAVYEDRNISGDVCEPSGNPGFNTNPS